jgi:hypothetical protein
MALRQSDTDVSSHVLLGGALRSSSGWRGLDLAACANGYTTHREDVAEVALADVRCSRIRRTRLGNRVDLVLSCLRTGCEDLRRTTSYLTYFELEAASHLTSTRCSSAVVR